MKDPDYSLEAYQIRRLSNLIDALVLENYRLAQQEADDLLFVFNAVSKNQEYREWRKLNKRVSNIMQTGIKNRITKLKDILEEMNVLFKLSKI